ncbi:MAG TPA: asparagine synthase-related protein [Candidatus Methanoperedens sp.]|nr:asparagine synthase-related protein [Candidatus Methanoperedens sp.]
MKPVMFGMAGVIYTGDGEDRGATDEPWLVNGFRMTSWTTKVEWRSNDSVILACQHAHEARTHPGSFQSQVPCAGDYAGIVFGHFFGVERPAPECGEFAEGVLRAYGRSGPSCFRLLNGAWVAVVWDRKRRQAHFVRDVTGVEVLYVSRLPGRIVFSTNVDLLQGSGIVDALDDQAIAEFLHYLYVPAPRTVVKGCVAVLPGHVLTVGSSLRQERYALDRFVSGTSLDSPDEVERQMEEHLPAFEDKLLGAVADCIPASGRVALTLSGGKDSSTLAVALSKICPERVLALTVGEREGRFSEDHDAALVCRALGLAHQTYVPSDTDLARGLHNFASVQDQPIGDPAALPYFLAMLGLPEDCTLIMDGTGNDSYFGVPSAVKGVHQYRRRVEVQKRVPNAVWPLLLFLMSHGPTGLRRLAPFWSRPVEESLVAWEGWAQPELAQLFDRDISFAGTYLWQVMRQGEHENWLALLTKVICGIWEPHTAFRKAFHFAHAAGRGIRFPFIDNRLAEFVNGVPEQLKFSGRVNKQILRAYMAKNLPRKIVEKPKAGFVFDLDRLFSNPEYRWADELNRAGGLRFLATWSEQPISDLLKRHRLTPGDSRWQQRLYALCLLVAVLAGKNGHLGTE